MQLSKEAILNKTHYGLNIYSFVLRNFYPGETVLTLSGRDCKPTKNPFNDNKPTLKVQIVDNCAEHFDTENAIVKGNVFDFAALYFNLEGDELLSKINEELYLRIGKPNGFYNSEAKPLVASIQEPVIIYCPQFSYFKAPVKNIVPAYNVSLLQVYQIIKGNSFASCTSTLRSIADKQQAKEFKAHNFDYVTFSGTFSKRSDNALIKHSNLLTIDFDHIPNIEELKSQLLQDEYFETELLFASPSGDGLKWVIPIDITRATHQDYFKAISNYLLQTYQLKIDQSGKDISRACFLPQDAAVFINPKYL